MRIRIHKTIMLDDTEVTDVDIMPNTFNKAGIVPRCIFTFDSGNEAIDFSNRLSKLFNEFGFTADLNVTSNIPRIPSEV